MEHTEGLTRRSVLRGAAVAGAAVWTVPVVQVATMTRASAAQPSAGSGCIDKERTPDLCGTGGGELGQVAVVGGVAVAAGTALVVAAQRRRQQQQDLDGADEPGGTPEPPVA